MSRSKTLSLAFVVARLALAVVVLRFALDWRSPELASVRPWALAALMALPVGLIAVEVRTLRRGVAVRAVRVLSAFVIASAAASLIAMLPIEMQSRSIQHQVLSADGLLLEKLGRHVVVGYRDIGELMALIERRAVAGVFITARNVEGRDTGAIRQEIAAMQEVRRRQGLPRLMIATDQEGGGVSRLSPPLSLLPPLSEIVAQHPDATERRKAVADYAARQARELADLGVNINFAPVVDLNHGLVNPDDRLTRIHARAISNDPQIVAETADTYCAQLAAAGVQCTLKHFPGLGRVFGDTHEQTADLAATPGELAGADWLPFRALMGRDDMLVMLSHARLTALDPDHPVSFSWPVVHDLVRGEWGYAGVLITDDVGMGAVYRSPEGIAGASIAALAAGVDLILVSYDVDQFYGVMHALLEAVRTGRLPDDALRESDRRLGRALLGRPNH
jgi:beta-N-acetylhexosaminidase